MKNKFFKETNNNENSNDHQINPIQKEQILDTSIKEEALSNDIKENSRNIPVNKPKTKDIDYSLLGEDASITINRLRKLSDLYKL